MKPVSRSHEGSSFRRATGTVVSLAMAAFLASDGPGALASSHGGPPVPGPHAFTKGMGKRGPTADRFGGALTVTVSRKQGEARFILPGTRELDPSVFGTPGEPVGFEKAPFPMLGIEKDLRLTHGDGYSIIDHATPFSNWSESTKGRVKMMVTDVTPIDAAETADKIDFEANFELPDGAKYRVEVKKPLPHGMAFPFFGGVVTNHLIHGVAGVAPRALPTTFAYAAFWGAGNVYKDGELINEGQLVHVWVSDDERGPDGGIRNDRQVGASEGLTLHMIVPPYRPTPKGMEKSPLKTMFMPFPYVKKNIESEMKAAKKAGDQDRVAVVKQIQKVMKHTKEHVVEATAAGKMFGMPFIHMKFDGVQVAQ